VPVSSLLACGAVHHHLVRKPSGRGSASCSKRAKPARCITLPAGRLRRRRDQSLPGVRRRCGRPRRDGLLPTSDDDKIVARLPQGVAKGMLKVMAKMGISTLQSYKGAQIFEAVGLNGTR
jgi:glutamate synthase (NADPH) large chain